MRFQGFIGPSYTSQSTNVDCQRCVNMFPEMDELGTGKEHEVASLVPTPGLRLLTALPTSPLRGEWRASNGTLFAVAGNKFYSVSSLWAATELGTLTTSTGPVSIADNGLQLFIVDGTDGYTWDINSSVFSVVTDENFYPADMIAFMDGYFIFNKKGSQQFFLSDLNDVTFSGLNIGTKEGHPDNIIGLTVSNQQLYLFGEQNTEVFYDSGDTFPFSRIQGAVVDMGVIAPFSVAQFGGAIFWLGGDENGSGIVYRMQGYQPQRISTPSIESVIRNLNTSTLSAARAWVYQQGGHQFYCLNLPGANSTWVYDAITNLWHERTYLNLWSQERHRADCHAEVYGVNVVGDYQNGNLYALDMNALDDNGTSIARIRTAPHISQGLVRVFHKKFQLDMETGVGTSGTGQGVNPKVMLDWSDDGGHSWSNEHWTDIGKIGKRFTRAIWRRLGSARDRVYRTTITDPVKVTLIGADLDVEAGVS